MRETCREKTALLLPAKKKKKKEKTQEVTGESGIRTACFKLNRKCSQHHPCGPGNRSQECLSGQCADINYTHPQACSHMWYLQLRCLREMGPREGRVWGRKQKQKEAGMCGDEGSYEFLSAWRLGFFLKVSIPISHEWAAKILVFCCCWLFGVFLFFFFWLC